MSDLCYLRKPRLNLHALREGFPEMHEIHEMCGCIYDSALECMHGTWKEHKFK